VSDRRGPFAPVRLGLVAVVPPILLFTAPDDALVLAVVVVAVATALSAFWTPAMALLADGAEAAGVRLAYAFALVNLAWAGGQVVGSAGGGALAQATSDFVPMAAIAGLCVLTRVALR
jgi:hypothetical protein